MAEKDPEKALEPEEEEDLMPTSIVEEYYTNSTKQHQPLVLEWQDIEYSMAITGTSSSVPHCRRK